MTEASPLRVLILGPGLLGGSLALALQDRAGFEVDLWGRNPRTVEEARSLGIGRATDDLASVVGHADMVILCTPVGAMVPVLRQVLDVRGEEKLIISDVGSVKRMPATLIRPLISGTGHRFIGGHPMAGSERTGVSAARADLFKGATTVLTPHPSESALDISLLQSLWEAAGAVCHFMTADEHDHAVGRLSHFPHLMASFCAATALKTDENSFVSGGGLRDTSRVAAGDPDMWAEILMENADSVTGLLEETIAEMRDVLASLQRKDHDHVRRFLKRAKAARDQLDAESTS